MDFGNNGIGKGGATALAALLKSCPSVADVNINMNDVGDDGAFEVRCGGVVQCGALQVQVPRGQEGGQERWLLLITFIHSHSFTSELPLQIATALSGNTTLKLLDVGGNNIGAEGAKALAGGCAAGDQAAGEGGRARWWWWGGVGGGFTAGC